MIFYKWGSSSICSWWTVWDGLPRRYVCNIHLFIIAVEYMACAANVCSNITWSVSCSFNSTLHLNIDKFLQIPYYRQHSDIMTWRLELLCPLPLRTKGTAEAKLFHRFYKCSIVTLWPQRWCPNPPNGIIGDVTVTRIMTVALTRMCIRGKPTSRERQQLIRFFKLAFGLHCQRKSKSYDTCAANSST